MHSNYAEIYSGFENWLDNLLENNDMPADTKAFNFNLYEESEGRVCLWCTDNSVGQV